MQTTRPGGDGARVASPGAARRHRARALLSVFVAGVLGLLALVAPEQAEAADYPTPGATSVPVVETTGANGQPLTAADVDLLQKVKLAGLWEMPGGRMAAEKGSLERVRQVGAMISQQHTQLDKLVEAAAKEVGVELPTQPNADQTTWLGEMTAASGKEFDQIFVDRLRAAHGKVFPAIANVRAGTRNDVVRKLAQQANGFVLTHLTLLESTGLVDYQGLPQPPQPSPTATTSLSANSVAGLGPVSSVSGVLGGSFWFVWVIGAAVLGFVGWQRYAAEQRKRRTPRRRYDEPPRRPPSGPLRDPEHAYAGPPSGGRPSREASYDSPSYRR